MPKDDTVRKVAIVGNNVNRVDAPWDDESYDFWIINGAIQDIAGRRIAKWFDLHDWSQANYLPDYLEHVPKDPDFDIVTMYEFPYAEVMAKYGYFWENSLPMMLGYAGYLEYTDIYLFGTEIGEFTDNPHMGFSLYHVMGALRREGRRVYLCNYSQMDTSGLYGYKDLVKTRLPDGFAFK